MSIVLAFSGGLDTSFCVPYLRETYAEPVHTVTVDTGGSGGEATLRARALELGATRHHHIDGRVDLFRDHLRYLIMGNVLRGGVYPLCVGSERVVQARKAVELANRIGARAIAHGSTGAGNDQVRFDGVVRLLGGDLDLITPIRDQGLTRADTTAFLKERGFDVPAKTTRYSINAGLWGTTVGGAETLSTSDPLPAAAYPTTVAPGDAPDEGRHLTITFTRGVPTALDDTELPPVALIEQLHDIGAAHGVGRDIHVGDTILGLKGRVGFEAPAPMILIAAHRELEKIVLTKWQRHIKDQLGDFYGMLLHEAQYYEPAMRDMEALLESSQRVVTGTVRVYLLKGHISIEGCTSPNSMFDPDVAAYGEKSALWDGQDARSFSKLVGLQSILAHRARTSE